MICMRIALFSWETLHSIAVGGVGVHVSELAAALQRRGHERHGTYCADRVIAVSNQLKEEIKWLYNVPDHKTQMIYNGVNSCDFDYEVDAGEVKRRYDIGPLDPTVLFVGRMVVQKGPDILV